MLPLRFWVPGVPLPQGSKTGFVVAGRVRLVEQANKKTKTRKAGALKRWRKAVAARAAEVMSGDTVMTCGVVLSARFFFERPPTHRKKNGTLRTMAPLFPGHLNGDLSKLIRAVEDALSGVVYKDDTQVVQVLARKDYGDRSGVDVIVTQKVTEYDLRGILS